MNLESREAANASGDIGHFFGALQIDGLIDKPNSKKNRRMVSRLSQNPPADTSGPLIDPEREAEAVRREEGIPLIKPVVDDLLDISKRTGIVFKER
jgi:L-2-hydroxycarboxylate dehydrogenase (NAD+)